MFDDACPSSVGDASVLWENGAYWLTLLHVTKAHLYIISTENSYWNEKIIDLTRVKVTASKLVVTYLWAGNDFIILQTTKYQKRNNDDDDDDDDDGSDDDDYGDKIIKTVNHTFLSRHIGKGKVKVNVDLYSASSWTHI